MALLNATLAADERAWADCLAAKGGGRGRVRCERRVELAAQARALRDRAGPKKAKAPAKQTWRRKGATACDVSA